MKTYNIFQMIEGRQLKIGHIENVVSESNAIELFSHATGIDKELLTAQVDRNSLRGNYKWHEDAGHSWLKVLLEEVKESGVEITPYSYKDETFAYLEEDQDAGTFLKSIGHTGFLDVQTIWDGDHSRIRNLQSY